MLNFLPNADAKVDLIEFFYYDINNVYLGNAQQDVKPSNGGSDDSSDWAQKRILYVGAFPGNLRNWDSVFQGLVTAGTVDHYTIQASSQGAYVSKMYTIQIKCPNEKGYEGIRLTWLNQWGVWGLLYF